MPRFYCPEPLWAGAKISLPPGATRHVQVLRLQPGDTVTLFGGTLGEGPDGTGFGGEFEATIAAMGRTSVEVLVGRHDAVERESAHALQLAIGMPANERMDWLVEKATELGVAGIQPLMSQHSVVRLDDERARKKAAHWSSIAAAACEQCGRNRVPMVHAAKTLTAWSAQIAEPGAGAETRLVLSLRPEAMPLQQAIADVRLMESTITLLCGPEGGLSSAEEAMALQRGFKPVSLGNRVLRSETAALAALTLLG